MKKATMLPSHIITIIFNQLNIKKIKLKKIILKKIIKKQTKKTMRRKTVAINNVLNKKITKLNYQSA